MDVILENFRRGGGVISGPKKYIADFFGFKTVYFGRKFWKKCPKRGKGGGSSPIQKNSLQIYAYFRIVAKKRNVISKNREGGSKAVWTFSKKTSKLENGGTPKLGVPSALYYIVTFQSSMQCTCLCSRWRSMSACTPSVLELPWLPPPPPITCPDT